VAAMAAARATVGSGPGSGPGAGPRADPSIKLGVPAKLKLGKRLAIRVTAPGAGSLSARLARGSRVVATGSAKAARAGDVRVRLRLRKGVKARALRGRRLALRVAWTGDAGGSTVAEAKLRAR
jgi:hypothetical protein